MQGASLAAPGVSPSPCVITIRPSQLILCINIYFSLMATKSVFMRIISHRPNNKCQVDLRVVVASTFFGLPLVQPAGYKLSHA